MYWWAYWLLHTQLIYSQNYMSQFQTLLYNAYLPWMGCGSAVLISGWSIKLLRKCYGLQIVYSAIQNSVTSKHIDCSFNYSTSCVSGLNFIYSKQMCNFLTVTCNQWPCLSVSTYRLVMIRSLCMVHQLWFLLAGIN